MLMDFIAFLSVITVLLFFSGTLVIGIISTGKYIAPWYKRNKIKPIGNLYRTFLAKNFIYYKKLANKDRKEFENRLDYFLKGKRFIPRNMPEVTEEMKVLVAACAAQLTFGLKPVKFAHFKNIVIYPTKYFSKYSNRTHSGEMHPNGTITFAWDCFEKGHKIPYDGYNLGLHEMAHALKFEDASYKGDYGVIEEKSLHQWHRVSTREMNKIKRGKKTFLRKYAIWDKEEFFAVCVEEFFEQPYLFRRELPEVYSAMCKLLNQDPTKIYRPVYEKDLSA
jgi:Mlc titration factor MtfA (ptsG expression regulator)